MLKSGWLRNVIEIALYELFGAYFEYERLSDAEQKAWDRGYSARCQGSFLNLYDVGNVCYFAWLRGQRDAERSARRWILPEIVWYIPLKPSRETSVTG